jgi:phosphopantetheinyl transferase (holo-ACP synthase)
MDLDEVSVSISHERRMAVAVAVAHRRHGPEGPTR